MNTLITGGSRGIGKAIAQELNRGGHNLLLVAKSNENLLKTKAELPNQKLRTEVFVCDLGLEEEIEKLFEYSESIDFKPEVLVFNAGIFVEGTLTNSKTENLHAIMNVNLYHVYHCVKKYVSILKQQEMPRIFIIGSTASNEPYSIGPLYGVAKWSLRGYTINLRKELMADRIGVTLINPGATLTELWGGIELPENRLLDPSDIGKVVSMALTLSNQAVIEEINIKPVLGDLH